ncbi:MAG: helix-turn-helix domain-containing protein [Rikenellaceae bacterium]
MQPQKIVSPTTALRKISILKIKKEMSDVSFLSNDMVITNITAETNYTLTQPVAFDGFSAIIMMCGEARVSIDLEEYDVKPRDIVVFSPKTTIKTTKCTTNAAAYLISFSRSFIDNLQIDLSTTLPLYMRFGKNPVLHLSQDDVDEIRQLFRLIKIMLKSDKEKYRTEIITTLFTTMFYILTELNNRDTIDHQSKKGRCEVIFDEFLSLLQIHSRTERNVKFYADKLNISTKYLSAVVKDVSGKTAAKWIDESVILEAKTLLVYSGLSIQEIANKLNFSTQSFFGKYFKQHTGMSPSRFKRKG